MKCHEAIKYPTHCHMVNGRGCCKGLVFGLWLLRGMVFGFRHVPIIPSESYKSQHEEKCENEKHFYSHLCTYTRYHKTGCPSNEQEYKAQELDNLKRRIKHYGVEAGKETSGIREQ